MSRTDIIISQDENLAVFDRWIEWTDGSNMLIHHLNNQAFTLLDNRDDIIAGLQTKEDWIARQRTVKDVLLKIVGPFPEKTPLNPQITGVVKKEGYRIEKVIYESMPEFYVTGCLYIPDAAKGKQAAILFVSGHAQESFRNEGYQVMILNLVKKGFIVFAIDPLSQGERIQHYDAATNASVIGPTTREHNYVGDQCFISAVSLARYFIWDGIRGIDYLLSRREVDPARIGVTGQSGGGTQSAYIFAFDERVKAGAPVNYITGFRRLLESIGPQDAEQNFYHGLLNGITHADLLEVRAPAPALIAAGTRDFFSIQGARETYSEVKKAYTAFGMENNLGFVEDDWGHGYTKKLREEVYSFFQKNLDLPGDPKDEDVNVLDPGELMVTKTGNVASSFENEETVFTLNRKESVKLVDKIEVARKDIDAHLDAVGRRARELSGYEAPRSGTSSVFRGRYRRDGYSVEMYALEGEEGYVIPMLLFVPDNGENFPGVIYIHPGGKLIDAAAGGRIEQLVKEGYVVAAPDLIGTGETKGRGNVAMLIGRSVTGIQSGDIVRVLNFLKSRKDININRIGSVAFDEMCPVLLHAAAFDKSIHSVVLSGPLISYSSVVMNKFYDLEFCGNYVAGALTVYDLPDLIGCIAPRKICLADLKDQLKQSASDELINEELMFPRQVYDKNNVSGNMNIIPPTNDINSMINWCLK